MGVFFAGVKKSNTGQRQKRRRERGLMEQDRPFLEAKLAEIRRITEQETSNAPLLQVGLNDWTAIIRDTKEFVTDENDRMFLNDRINERIERASRKWTFLPTLMLVKDPHDRICIVKFKVASENEIDVFYFLDHE
jgi:hypothetical protein